jgi:hypothetical protein
MAADILSLAQDFYDGAVCDPAEKASLLADHKALRTGIRQGTKTGSILGAVKNGVSMNMRQDFTISERLKAMSMAIKCLEIGIRPSSTSRVRF